MDGNPAAMPGNVKVIVLQGLRSFAESDALSAQGRTMPGPIVANMESGSSGGYCSSAQCRQLFTGNDLRYYLND